MKKLVLLFAAGITLASAKAQVQFGVKAGLNLANLSISGDDNEFPGKKMKADFHAGVLVSLPLFSNFTLQPEAVYSAQGTKISADGQSGKLNFSYINVPVLFKYNDPSGFFAETGPQIGFLTTAKESAEGTSVSIKDALKSTDFSWALGVGYKLPMNLGLDVRYNLGLTNIAKNASDGESLKNGVLQIGVFYLFGGSAPKKK